MLPLSRAAPRRTMLETDGWTFERNERFHSMSSAQELPTQYDPRLFEDAVYAQWEKAGVFGTKPTAGRRPYTIVIPPPNITGVLHIGHALNNSLQDLLTRWRR